MSCESDSVERLRAAGQKVTPQRLLVLDTLRHVPGHHTAHEIHAIVRKTYPYVDVSTVYRTLATLRRLRLVSEMDMGSGDYTYEWNDTDSHHHLICRNCGTAVEIEGERLAALGEELRVDYGFSADLDHFAIVGLCSGCAFAAQQAQPMDVD